MPITMKGSRIADFNRKSKAKVAKTMAKAKQMNRASKGQLLKDKATAKSMNMEAKTRYKKTRMRSMTATALGAEATGAYTATEEQKTKRADFQAQKLKSWNDLIDGNPNPASGQQGQTQNKSTTEIDSTDRKIRESINYG